MLSVNPRDRPSAKDILKMISPMKTSMASFRKRNKDQKRHVEALEMKKSISNLSLPRFDETMKGVVKATLKQGYKMDGKRILELTRFSCMVIKLLIFMHLEKNRDISRLVLIPFVIGDIFL